MSEELAKIEEYYREGTALWQVNPTLVQSREFYELWEAAHQPKPFRLREPLVEIVGHSVELAGDGPWICYFTWDVSESCAAVFVESKLAEQKLLLLFNYGEPYLVEQPLVLMTEREVSLGERLEVMFDVIAWLRDRYPSRDVREMNRRDFNDAMAALAPDLERTTFRVVKRTPFSRIKKLLQKAVEDMAEDELSDQLSLPLDGSYAVSLSPIPRAGIDFDAGMPPVSIELVRRTKWEVLSELKFVQRTATVLAEMESAFVLDLRNCEVLNTDSPAITVLQVPVSGDVPLREGDRLQVHEHGDREPIGTLHVDLLERNAVIGRLIYTDHQRPDLSDGRYFARPRRGPANYIARMFDMLIQQLSRKGDFEANSIRAMLGIGDSTLHGGTTEPRSATSDLDFSQERAWANAVNDDNPVAIIQGPPGTGKTHVLEKVLRTFIAEGRRVLITAPSHTAVDNVCKRVLDLPLLRVARDREKLAPEVANGHWIGDMDAVRSVVKQRKGKEIIYGGTHVGVLRDDVVLADFDRHGLFDVIVFDEAGMARLDEFLLCASHARRVVLFGDHQQLPPFPLPQEVLLQLEDEAPPSRRMWSTVKKSAMEWLIDERQVPVYLLQASYRCQNPRLMRFSSTLFYNARVKASAWAEYYRLSYAERVRRYPPSSLRFLDTGGLPPAMRHERMVFEGGRPGIENPLEADLAAAAFYQLAARYSPWEITLIVPYRRQVRLIRRALDLDTLRRHAADPDSTPSEAEWDDFLRTRISTVDSFQGSESDAVIITYVRSNDGRGIGFVDDPSRVNVAHTRCRREMVIIGDLQSLREQARTDIFQRMERAIGRDGEIHRLTSAQVSRLPESLPGSHRRAASKSATRVLPNPTRKH